MSFMDSKTGIFSKKLPLCLWEPRFCFYFKRFPGKPVMCPTASPGQFCWSLGCTGSLGTRGRWWHFPGSLVALIWPQLWKACLLNHSTASSQLQEILDNCCHSSLDDKKELGAARRSQYYMKYGNPNYGGMKGILSNSWWVRNLLIWLLKWELGFP